MRRKVTSVVPLKLTLRSTFNRDLRTNPTGDGCSPDNGGRIRPYLMPSSDGFSRQLRGELPNNSVNPLSPSRARCHYFVECTFPLQRYWRTVNFLYYIIQIFSRSIPRMPFRRPKFHSPSFTDGRSQIIENPPVGSG